MADLPRSAQLGDRTITRIGLGTNRLTDTAENRQFLADAVAAGLDFIDTAHLYTDGASETAIGNALAPFPEGLTVATKGGYSAESGVDRVRAELEQSFERLQTETIALYYAHRLFGETFDNVVGLLGEYRDAGRIEHIGISDVSVEEIERARQIAPIAAVQNEYNLSERGHDDVIDYCEREGILFVPFYPLGADDTSGLRDLAGTVDATVGQVQLAWLLQRSSAVAPIPGTLSLGHLRENLAALDLDLPDEDLEALA